jgi:hypothetical protein
LALTGPLRLLLEVFVVEDAMYATDEKLC